MRFLKRAWQEIRRGENIDLYATIVVAFVVVVLGLVGIVGPAVLTSLTLATLAALAFSTLGNRHRLEDLPHKFANLGQEFFQDEHPVELDGWLASASEVWLVGASLGRTVKTNYTLLSIR